MPHPIHATIDRIVHCDWGSRPDKRAMCVAKRCDDRWTIDSIAHLDAASTLLAELLDPMAPESRTLIGFDFAIGMPKAFFEQTQLTSFLDALRLFGGDGWERFFDKAYHPHEVNLRRPFYPQRSTPRGFTSRDILTTGLGIRWEDLFRSCERATVDRNAASPIFWTLGAKQVGTGTLLGWKEVLQPLLFGDQRKIGIWPFEGDLTEILKRYQAAIVETYPNEAYHHLGFPKKWTGKTNQQSRRLMAANILSWCERSAVQISADLLDQIQAGFGTEKNGEDAFDALIGACAMVAVVIGQRPASPRLDACARHMEGWIFGQTARAIR